MTASAALPAPEQQAAQGTAHGIRTKTVMIDNYDSFTWNVVGLLAQLGADVVVFRNDQVSIDQLKEIAPRNILLTGPGHPRDAGISMQVIHEFAGVIPILGVCLGEQCMFEAYGGTVKYAGEIVHGKTSPVSHDGKGLYKGVSQGIEVTRYHSLSGDINHAGDKYTLPDCLEITITTQSGVVMGVRHRKFTIEGVQYHPESIASEEGARLFANFLSWEGGSWDTMIERQAQWIPHSRSYYFIFRPVHTSIVKNERKRIDPIGGSIVGSGIPISKISKLNSTGAVVNGSSATESILEKIKRQRLQDVSQTIRIPGRSLSDLKRSLSLGLAPRQIDFPSRILSAQPNVAVLAEIKRASPSKGAIDMGAHAPSQAVLYATSGASAISVLTEPTWFKGSLEDLRQTRLILDKIEDRPAVLLKDFVVDEYQIYEARLAGADTVLLIVAILLEDGIFHARLHTFTVDMSRTSSLASMVPKETILIALSGITGRKDVEKYISGGAMGVLVGEHIMKAKNKREFIRELIGLPTAMEISSSNRIEAEKSPLVKICGITNEQDAIVAAEAGADFLGLIFAKSPRQIDSKRAKHIIDSVLASTKSSGESVDRLSLPTVENVFTPVREWYLKTNAHVRTYISQQNPKRPLFVGVFSDTGFEEINKIVRETGLDIVQLHGHEDVKLVAPLICVPVIKAIHVYADDSLASVVKRIEEGTNVLLGVLLDTGVKGVTQQGGSGSTFDWSLAEKVGREFGIPIWMAGGLDADNVQQALSQGGSLVVGVDIASGVEGSNKGQKDARKVNAFVTNAKRSV
ncbi:bifunctional tryptophan synthase trp1 [Entophlyctis luteolus]|nr:bifunctional tryptophan synthase trp1 [Entophlyctis luteolus]